MKQSYYAAPAACTSQTHLSPLGASTLSPDNVIAFNYSRYSHALLSVLQPPFHAHHFSLRSNENIRSMCNLPWKCKRQIQVTARFQIAVHHKIQSLRRDVARLSL